MEIVQIKASEIDVSPKNPRRSTDEAGIKELASSFEEMGILQPIMVVKKKNKRYEVVFGSRRLMAAKLLDPDFLVPATVSSGNEKQLALIRIIENLQREDIDPIDEAQSFRDLMKQGFTVEQSAAQVGKTPYYVGTRIQLTELIDDLKQYMKSGDLPIGHALELAKYEHEIQQKVFDNEMKNWNGFKVPSLKILKEVMHRYMKSLKEAPFDIYDETLVESAGACTTCPKNTACQTIIFKEYADDAQCMDFECYYLKKEATTKRRIAEVLQEHPDIPILNESYSHPDEDLKQLKKEGYNVVPDKGEFEIIQEPEKPDPIMSNEDFLNSDLYDEEFDNPGEAYQDYLEERQEEMEDYKAELEEYNIKIKSPLLKRVLIGQSYNDRDTGKVVFAIPKIETNSDITEENYESKVALSELLKTEMDLKAKLKRNDEIAFEKIYEETTGIPLKEEDILTTAPLTTLEKKCLFVIAYKASSHYWSPWFKKLSFFDENKFRQKNYLIELIEGMSSEQHNQFLRACIYSGLSGHTIGLHSDPTNFNYATCWFELIKAAKTEEVQAIETKWTDKYDNKKVSLIARLKELKEEIKSIKLQIKEDEEE